MTLRTLLSAAAGVLAALALTTASALAQDALPRARPRAVAVVRRDRRGDRDDRDQVHELREQHLQREAGRTEHGVDDRVAERDRVREAAAEREHALLAAVARGDVPGERHFGGVEFLVHRARAELADPLRGGLEGDAGGLHAAIDEGARAIVVGEGHAHRQEVTLALRAGLGDGRIERRHGGSFRDRIAPGANRRLC